MKLKALRVNKDLTQQDMADLLGISKLTYMRWENNINNLKIEDIKRIAEVLKVKANDIEEVRDLFF